MKIICVEISWLDKSERLALFYILEEALYFSWSKCSEEQKEESIQPFETLREQATLNSHDDGVPWASIVFYDGKEITFSSRYIT